MVAFILKAGLAVVTAIIGAAGKLFINGLGYYPERWLADRALKMTGVVIPHQTASLLIIAGIAVILYAIAYYFLFWRRVREARTSVAVDDPKLQCEIAEGADPWDDLNEAARRFRDMLRTQPEQTALHEFDRSARHAATESKRDPVVYAFHFWLVMGLQDGILECRGTNRFGSEQEPICGEPDNSIEQHHLSETDPSSLRMEDGQIFQNIEVRRTTLRTFANYLGQTVAVEDGPEAENRRELRQVAAEMFDKTKTIHRRYLAYDDERREKLYQKWREFRDDLSARGEYFVANSALYGAIQDAINRCDIVVDDATQGTSDHNAMQDAFGRIRALMEKI